MKQTNLNKTIVSVLVIMLLLTIIPNTFAKTLKEKDAAARLKYKDSKEQYLKEVSSFKVSKKQFLDAKNKYKQFKTAENKKDLEYESRLYLTKTAEMLQERLESMKNWVSNRRALEDSEKQNIINEIQQDINWLNTKVDKIQAATPEQLKQDAKDIREYWKNHRVKAKKIIGSILSARNNFLIKKAEKFFIRASGRIQALKQNNKNVAPLEAWLSDFEQKILLTKEKQGSAKAKFQAISNVNEANQLFVQGREFIKEGNQYIKQAHIGFVNAIKSMKK